MYCDRRDLPVLTHSFPTRRSSDLVLLVGPQHQRAESAEKDALLLNHLDILAVDLPVLADVHQVDARDLADARLPSLWRVVQVLEELEQRLGAGDFDAFLRRGRAGNAQRGKPADRSAQNAARSAAAPQKPCIKALRHGRDRKSTRLN